MRTFALTALSCLVFTAVVIITCTLFGVHPWIAGAVATFGGGCYTFGMCLAVASEGPNWRWPITSGIIGVCFAFSYLFTSGAIVQ